jgi:putative ABC transport system substrate-binding protein
VRRREFIALVGAAAAWPHPARAQQAIPVIGFLDPASPDTFADHRRAFHLGLKEAGFIEGDNVAISYRWAENQSDRLPELANDLVRRQVAVIATVANGVFAAKAATKTIPIVFIIADDPVRLGLVASLARPDGNLTGINFLNAELTAKRLELLRELVPGASRVAVLFRPEGANTEAPLKDMDLAAHAMGLRIQVLNASNSREIDIAFEALARERPDALLVTPDPFFRSRRMQLTHLATRHAIPAAYALRDYAEAGGLISYGASLMDAYHQTGAYAGRILKGAKPADLPVVQSSKFELIINAQTARILGLTVPPSLLARADEVIE